MVCGAENQAQKRRLARRNSGGAIYLLMAEPYFCSWASNSFA